MVPMDISLQSMTTSKMSKKRTGTDSLPSSNKRSKIEESHSTSCSMNSCYTCASFIENFSSQWRNQKSLNDDSTGARLLARPFQCCCLPSFISCQPSDSTVTSQEGDHTEAFLHQLQTEVLRLKLYEKNNDLYQFHQSDDLKRSHSPCISALRSLLREECLPWLRTVTGIELTDTIDMTCSKYEYTDVLLCHDDELEGRRIAFILYLVPNWTPEDGGSLDLFNVDENGQPSDIAMSLLPVWNNFVFFDVNAVSFHQVSEVMNPCKSRLSINGWFHGPSLPRPSPYKEVSRPLHPPISMGLEVLSDWINPMYLDVGVQSQIQSQFEDDSQIELPDFLLEEKFSQLHEEMCAHKDWSVVGAPNKRHVHLADNEGLPSLTKFLVSLLQSEPFCLLLSHLTGLDLAENIIRDTESSVSAKDPPKDLPSSSSVPTDSASNRLTPSKEEPISKDSQSSQNGGKKEPVALCRYDVYSWQHGDYTLAGDEGDPGLGRFALEALLHFCSEGWSPDYGGTVSYIAKDVDDELLSISPQPNALSLVYRDKDSLSFTKYINHRVQETNWLNSINVTYVENS